MSAGASAGVGPREVYGRWLEVLRRLFEQISDGHERGFQRVASESTDRYHAEIVDIRALAAETVPGIAEGIRSAWASGLPAPLLADAESDLRAVEQAIGELARPMVHTPTLMGWNLDENGREASPTFALDPEHFTELKAFRHLAAECQARLVALGRWTGYLPHAASASPITAPGFDAPPGKADPPPSAAPALPVSLATLTDRAVSSYARTKGGFLLVACPDMHREPESPGEERPGLPVQRVTEDDPNCWRFVGESINLPFPSFHYLGWTTIKDVGGYYLVLGDPRGSGLNEVTEFLTFAKDAGALMRASPPAQLSGGGGMSSDLLWASVLVFREPSAAEAVVQMGDCRVISQPWAASLIAIRALRDASPQEASGVPVGKEGQQDKDGRPVELTAVERALVIYARDPNQSLRAVARQVGCAHSLLVRDPRFQRMRQAIAGVVSRGSKSKGGDMEAESE
jgi:hypothetical protein